MVFEGRMSDSPILGSNVDFKQDNTRSVQASRSRTLAWLKSFVFILYRRYPGVVTGRKEPYATRAQRNVAYRDRSCEFHISAPGPLRVILPCYHARRSSLSLIWRYQARRKHVSCDHDYGRKISERLGCSDTQRPRPLEKFSCRYHLSAAPFRRIAASAFHFVCILLMRQVLGMI